MTNILEPVLCPHENSILSKNRDSRDKSGTCPGHVRDMSRIIATKNAYREKVGFNPSLEKLEADGPLGKTKSIHGDTFLPGVRLFCFKRSTVLRRQNESY